ncbi:unnamed protein product, partial [Laminaria digitata]
AGVDFLKKGRRVLFSGQHAALMAVRPDAEIYKMLEGLLCKGDSLISDAYPGLPKGNGMEQGKKREEFLERRAPTTPLLHLAVNALSGRPPIYLPLETCGGGSNQPKAGALPFVWCPAPPDSARRLHRNLDTGDGNRSSSGRGLKTGDGNRPSPGSGFKNGDGKRPSPGRGFKSGDSNRPSPGSGFETGDGNRPSPGRGFENGDYYVPSPCRGLDKFVPCRGG